MGDDAGARVLDGWTERPLEAESGTAEARQLQLLARYGLVERLTPQDQP